MGHFKNILLGAGAAFVSVGAAVAADLPVRKAAPVAVEYVRVCDAYGRGFFYIPGTDTCIRIGGRLRADYSFVPAQNLYSGITPGGVPIIAAGGWAGGQHETGFHARGRISFDVRTRTAWGVVQAAASLRMARQTGVIAAVTGATTGGTGSTLETAYIRFAGFTFGAGRDNFAMLPSITYGAGHWGSFANGAKQIAYTHSFGGGFSATIALQDYEDTNNAASPATTFFGAPPGGLYYVYNTAPQLNARLQWDQGWGGVTVAGAWANVSYNNAADTYDRSTDVWAIGAAVKLNLPMLARGSAMWLHAAYADGMTEYTINWASRKTSAYQRDVGGFVNTAPSLILTPTGIDTVKSWNVAALLQHFWTPQWRTNAWASYGQMDVPTSASQCGWNGAGCIGDTTVWNVGTNLAWLPTRDFEIGVEVIYARVTQDVRSGAGFVPFNPVYRAKDDNITGRLRIERNF